jgi:pyruvate,water dikinase
MIQFLDEINNAASLELGGKAKSLIKLAGAGFCVPQAFFIENGSENADEILHAFGKLDAQFVAVRSSANLEDGKVDSFAGQFETFLFVNQENLLSKIRECFASASSERIKNYCAQKEIDFSSIKLSVVVQKMIFADVAGVCLTKHPVSNDTSKFVIEAAYGLGEALVSGSLTPDTYIVEALSGAIIEKDISEQTFKLVLDTEGGFGGEAGGGSRRELRGGGLRKVLVDEAIVAAQKLSDQQIAEVFAVASDVAALYQMPMDIEWAYEADKLYILQARPVTG